MVEKFKAMRGTHDVLPEESWLWRQVENSFISLCTRYAYREIRTPIFEATELFERGTGISTEVVQKEMYTFLDRKGRRISLRPEATPSVIRAFLEHNLARRARISKFFYIGPMFRYDRPGAGRYRQFNQLGVELLGTSSPEADAEVILLLWEFLNALAIQDLKVRLNSLGCKDCRKRFTPVLKEFLSSQLGDLCSDCKERYERNPLRAFDCKVETCKKIMALAPTIDTILCTNCKNHFGKVADRLELVGVDFYVDTRLVRGLDYYTRTVFEIFSSATGVENSLGGGGRYDELVEELGGPPTPAVGFSAGLERIIMAIKDSGSQDKAKSWIDIFIAPVGEASFGKAFEIAAELRKKYKVWFEYDTRKIDRQLSSASKLRVLYTVIIGEDELARGVVRIKDMKTGEQFEVERSEILTWFEKALRG